MKIAVHDHRGTSRRFGAALAAAGHDIVAHGGDVLLTDLDIPFATYENLCDLHERVFLYPHGGGVPISWDGQWPIHAHTRGHFVYAAGHVDVMRSYGYPLPVEPVGWALSDTAPFRPTDEPWRVLYAPMHPDNDGHLAEVWRQLNSKVHDDLADRGFDLMVRVGHDDPALFGIDRRSNVTYAQSFGLDHAQIDVCDVVVSYPSTFAYLAVARGCPTVMYGQNIRPGDTNWTSPQRETLIPKHWETWRHICRYPYEATEGDLTSTIRTACVVEAAHWRERFVGEQLDPARFVEQFEHAASAW